MQTLFTNLWFEIEKFNEDGRIRKAMGINPRWRVSDKFTTSMTFRINHSKNEQGWVDDSEDVITFGRRDRRQYVSGLNARYTFTNNMNIDLRSRHNWTQVKYDQFTNLNSEGGLDRSAYSDNHDVTFNSFTIDLVYRWRFLPGSDLFITYKNNLQDSREEAIISYGDNFKDLFSYSQSNSISFKLIYYLEYTSIKK